MKLLKVKFLDSLFTNLMFWFFILVFIPLFISTFKSYQHSVKSLEAAAKHELKQSSMISKKFIDSWFDYRIADISNWSKRKTDIKFLELLIKDFKNSKLSLKDYVKCDTYQKIISKNEQDLITLTSEYDYIYDLFFIDNDGNILYTVEKESDLATSLIDGNYANTKFATSFRETKRDGKIHFSDLELYAPSKGTVAGFLTAPIFDSNLKQIGVLAVQIKLERIFSLFDDSVNGANSFSHYLVGYDSLLRSAVFSGEKVLEYKIKSKQFELWKKEYSNEKYTKSYLENVIHYLDPFGTYVIGVHQNIDILDIHWALMSEVREDIVLESISKLRNETIIFFIITMIIAIIVAMLITRRITKPIMKLYKANIDFAKGKKDVHVDIKQKGEFSLLGDSFNNMITILNTNEKKLKEQTQESHKALQELDEQKHALNAHSIVAITDVKGNIIFVNDKFTEISGYSREELIGKNHRLLNSGAHSIEVWKEMYDALSNGKTWRKDICNVAKNGQYYWVSTTIVPFMDDNGKPKSYIAIRTDITDEKNVEFKLLEANELAIESVKIKSEFLASMSHEIRTPMNGVIGMLGLLLSTGLTETQRHQAELAQSSASSLLALINDILDFSKVEAGKMELEYIDFDLRDEFGKFAEAMAFKAQEKGVDLLLDLTEVEKTLVNADPGRIRQILSNIVGNSIKFTHEGYILIRVTLNTINSTKARLIVEMSDTGIGIPENKLDTLFDTFSQVDASTTRKYGGTGLGLSIVKKLSELMDGDIKVASNFGYGSTFTVDIAVNIPENSSLVKPHTSVDGKKILIIDTSEYSIDVLQGQLEHWGMDVSSTCSANDAISIMEKEIFDIVFLDMYIKDADVYEFSKLIRADEKYDDIKIVIMTSLADRGNALRYSEIGIDASFPKPATTHDLFLALDTLNTDISKKYVKESIEVDKGMTLDSSINILLVEDNLTNQLVANGILEMFNLEADIANNGVEAIEILNKNEKKYDIVLMDCQMPEMDGYETTEAIRSSKAGDNYIHIPIVAMTANAMAGDKEKCIDSGMDDYLAKPINPEKLKVILHKYLYNEELSDMSSVKEIKSTSSSISDIWNMNDALARLGGSEKLLSKIVNVFLDDILLQSEALKQGILNNDMAEVRLHAHAIKGSAGNLSAIKLQSQAKYIEKSVKDEDTKTLQKNYENLQGEIEELLLVLNNYLNKVHIDKKTDMLISKHDLVNTLSALRVDIADAKFIDTDDMDLFSSLYNDEINEHLNLLKHNVDNFMSDEALVQITQILKKLGDNDE